MHTTQFFISGLIMTQNVAENKHHNTVRLTEKLRCPRQPLQWHTQLLLMMMIWIMPVLLLLPLKKTPLPMATLFQATHGIEFLVIPIYCIIKHAFIRIHDVFGILLYWSKSIKNSLPASFVISRMKRIPQTMSSVWVLSWLCFLSDCLVIFKAPPQSEVAMITPLSNFSPAFLLRLLFDQQPDLLELRGTYPGGQVVDRFLTQRSSLFFFFFF